MRNYNWNFFTLKSFFDYLELSRSWFLLQLTVPVLVDFQVNLNRKFQSSWFPLKLILPVSVDILGKLVMLPWSNINMLSVGRIPIVLFHSDVNKSLIGVLIILKLSSRDMIWFQIKYHVSTYDLIMLKLKYDQEKHFQFLCTSLMGENQVNIYASNIFALTFNPVIYNPKYLRGLHSPPMLNLAHSKM